MQPILTTTEAIVWQTNSQAAPASQLTSACRCPSSPTRCWRRSSCAGGTACWRRWWATSATASERGRPPGPRQQAQHDLRRHLCSLLSLAVVPHLLGDLPPPHAPPTHLPPTPSHTHARTAPLFLPPRSFHMLLIIDAASGEEVARARQCVDEMVRLAQDAGGTCTGEHGIGHGKLAHLEREHGGAALQVGSSCRPWPGGGGFAWGAPAPACVPLPQGRRGRWLLAARARCGAAWLRHSARQVRGGDGILLRPSACCCPCPPPQPLVTTTRSPTQLPRAFHPLSCLSGHARDQAGPGSTQHNEPRQAGQQPSRLGRCSAH